MDISSRRETFVARCLSELARSAGFHPVELACPGLAGYRELGEHVLLRELPDGYWQMILLVGCDEPADLAAAAEKVADFAEAHPSLTERLRLRVSCVGVGAGGLSRGARRRLLKPLRMQQDHVVIRRFWLSLDLRRMFAFHSPWGFAPGFEINPCDPDDNLFVLLVRADRYLRETPPPPPTQAFHRLSLARERSFLAGLAGGQALVRTLLTLNILVWLLLEFSGGSTRPVQLIRAGAKANGLILAGQYWRLVTPIFLHFGVLHLVLNVLGLFFLGEVLERIYGTMQFGLVYFVSGVVSVVTSFLFGRELMVGASGAIFGLAGALVVYGWRCRSRIPRRYGAMFGGGLLPLIGINVLLGVFVKGIDNAAHVGGLVAGTLVTLGLRPLADQVAAPSWTSPRRLAALAAFGVVLGSLLAAAVFFVRFDVFETDARWGVRTRTPGNLSLFVPGSWLRMKHDQDELAFRSVCYDGRLDVRARDVAHDAQGVFLDELKRVKAAGFRIVGETALTRIALMNELFTRGRVQLLMQHPRQRQRQQVFLLPDDALVSIGVEVSEKDAARFAPVLDRILAPLPEPAGAPFKK